MSVRRQGLRYGIKVGKQRALDALYNNVTPLGYANDIRLPFMNHKQEMIDAAKEFFTPKRINTSTSIYPRWYKRAMNWADKNPSKNPFPMSDSFKDIVRYRDDAFRLATNQKPRRNLYLSNGDGTYRYNMQLVTSPRKSMLVQKLSPTKAVGIDPITGNGGFGTYTFDLPLNLRPYPNRPEILYAGKPGFTFTDTWDIQPFKDVSRTYSPLITKLGTKYPYIFGKLKNIEVLKTLGGNPFKLKHEVPSGVIHIGTKQLNLPK